MLPEHWGWNADTVAQNHQLPSLKTPETNKKAYTVCRVLTLNHLWQLKKHELNFQESSSGNLISKSLVQAT